MSTDTDAHVSCIHTTIWWTGDLNTPPPTSRPHDLSVKVLSMICVYASGVIKLTIYTIKRATLLLLLSKFCVSTDLNMILVISAVLTILGAFLTSRAGLPRLAPPGLRSSSPSAGRSLGAGRPAGMANGTSRSAPPCRRPPRGSRSPGAARRSRLLSEILESLVSSGAGFWTNDPVISILAGNP